MQVAVTGASGFLGAHLCARLQAEGHTVRAVVRGNAAAEQVRAALPVEVCQSELADVEGLTRVFDGCAAVFHAAGAFSMWPRDREYLLAVNTDGTHSVLVAARRAGVGRVIYTSSTNALGIPPAGAVGDERTGYNWESYRLPYMESKHMAELAVLEAAAAGQNAVIVNPGTIVGPGDRNFTGGRWVRDMARGRIPGWTEGGMNFVPVDDVVAGHLAAWECGRSGERYILGGENLDYRSLFASLAALCGRATPRMHVPRWSFGLFARMQVWRAMAGGPAPDFTPESVPIAYLQLYYSSAKAERELGYRAGPVGPAFQAAYDWYRARNLL